MLSLGRIQPSDNKAITLNENIPLLVEYFYHSQPQFSLLQHQICPLSPESVFRFFQLLSLQKGHTKHSILRALP